MKAINGISATSKKYLNRLATQQQNGDQEEAHIEADSILCELLHELGYEEVVKAYQKIDKWYA